MRAGLAELLAARGVLLADGATGTNYFAAGLDAGEAPELWNVDHPDRVQDLHRRFVDAGADIVLTNTFGCNRHRLALHGAEALVAGGADVAWIETMSAPEEVRAAANAAIALGVPYVATCSFDTAGRTMMGLLPGDLTQVFTGLATPPVATGANCGV